MNSRIVVESFSFFCILAQFQNVEIENFLLTLSFAWFCQASKRFSSSQMIKCYCEVHILPYRIPCEKKKKKHIWILWISSFSKYTLNLHLPSEKESSNVLLSSSILRY